MTTLPGIDPTGQGLRFLRAMTEGLSYFGRDMTMKTLYVSDLDGTLLRSNISTSDFTNRTINDLVGKGMLFS